MAVQPNSRTDWRWRVVADHNWRRQSQDLLTQPGFNLVPGDAEFQAFFPEAYRRRHTDRGFVQSAPMSLLSLDTPVFPPVWENPKGYRRSVELLTWIQTRGPEYDDQEVKPFHQDEWPVPRGYPFPLENRGFVAGSPLIVIATPFNQTDWPVPKGYPFPLENRGFVSGSPLIVIATPFNQLDWPVPKGRPFPLEDRGFIHPASPDLLLTPFNQLDWPVPKGRPYPISLRWLGPQSLHYIYTRAGYGIVSDAYAYGGKVLDDFTHGGTLSDAFAHGLLLSDDFAYGGTIDDDYTDGGTATDE